MAHELTDGQDGKRGSDPAVTHGHREGILSPVTNFADAGVAIAEPFHIYGTVRFGTVLDPFEIGAIRNIEF